MNDIYWENRIQPQNAKGNEIEHRIAKYLADVATGAHVGVFNKVLLFLTCFCHLMSSHNYGQLP